MTSPCLCIRHGRSQVRLLHLGIGAHSVRRIEGNHFAIDHDGDLVGQTEDNPHIVLHGEKRLADSDLLDQPDEARGFTAAHPGRGLVEQDDPRAARNRDADFQSPLFSVGQVHAEHIALFVEFDHLHELLGALVGIIQVGQELQEGVLVAQTPEYAAAQVLEHAELGEDVRDMEAA